MAVILTQALADARIGFDYSLAAQTLRTDMTGVLTWSMPGSPPPWLAIDAATGALSGRPTSANCGVIAGGGVQFRVTNGTLTVNATIPLTVSLAPNGIDLIPRIISKIGSTADNCQIDQLNLIAQAALQVITDYTEIPFGGPCNFAAFTDESVATRSYSTRVIQKSWPVQTITAASWGSTVLSFGTLKDLYAGKVQLAAEQDGEFMRLGAGYSYGDDIHRRTGPGDGYIGLFVSYTAGYVALPSDLYEAFLHIGLLLFQEKGRTGFRSIAVGESTTSYDRTFPPIIQAILSKYRRLSYG